MRKHKLEIDDLKVDSFSTDDSIAKARGTVRGQAGVYPTPSCGDTETYGEYSCRCLYARTDPDRICCNSDIWCANGCGGGTYTCYCGTGGGGSAPEMC